MGVEVEKISGVVVPPVKGIHTGDVKEIMSQSEAGLGAQGPIIPQRRNNTSVPHPKDDAMPDG